MSVKLSKYKFKKIAKEALLNGPRLHFDSIILYHKESYPSSLQLSIIAIEEISKANWVQHYYYSSITNQGFPDPEFEQNWLKMLYYHPEKQKYFFRDIFFEFPKKFIDFVISGQLEKLKQKATYVGLDKSGKSINVNSRISLPRRINKTQAKKIISILNDTLLENVEIKISNDYYFEIEDMDSVLGKELQSKLLLWKHRSGIKSKKRSKEWFQPKIS